MTCFICIYFLLYFSPKKLVDRYHTNKIAEIVATTGETVNVTDAQQDPRLGRKVYIS